MLFCTTYWKIDTVDRSLLSVVSSLDNTILDEDICTQTTSPYMPLNNFVLEKKFMAESGIELGTSGFYATMLPMIL